MEVAVTDRIAVDTGEEEFEVPREDLDACYSVIRDHMSDTERFRNVARIAANLMTMYEDGWIDVEEAVVKAEYFEAILWEAFSAEGIVARNRNAGRA
jgi:hypothetical protein